MISWRVLSIFSITFLSFLHKNPFLEANILFIAQSLLAYISPFARIACLILSLSWTSFKTWLICLTSLQMLSQKKAYLKHKDPSQVLVPNLAAVGILCFSLGLSWKQSICSLGVYLLWALSIPFLYAQRQNLKMIFYKNRTRYLLALSIILSITLLTSNSVFIHILAIGLVLEVCLEWLSTLEVSALSSLLMLRIFSADPIDFFIMLALSWIQICALYRGLVYVPNSSSTTEYSRKVRTQIDDQPLSFSSNLSAPEL